MKGNKLETILPVNWTLQKLPNSMLMFSPLLGVMISKSEHSDCLHRHSEKNASWKNACSLTLSIHC